ncbi:MAG: hypothetical protein ACXWKQ_01550 [Reyranella sp.]
MAIADKSHPFGWLIDSLAAGGHAPPGSKPKPEPRPDFQADLIRPDDLLTLHVDGYNLHVVPRVDRQAIDRIDATKDSFLVVTFPPQNIAETAYFETTGTKEPPLPPGIPAPPAGFPPAGSPPLPGQTGARLARFTRLAFRVAANAAMPPISYSIEGLLDWTGLELVVTPLADLPPTPSAAQIAGAPGIAPPGARATAIELPYRLVLSPNHAVAWRHATAPVTYASRTELWHTRLALKADDGTVSDLSADLTAPLRAIWSPDFNPARTLDPSQQPVKTTLDPDLGVTDISPNDRHQLVVLTSAFHGYADANGAPFVPSPVDAQMLMLSPLGGWLRSRGHWDPPHGRLFIPWPPRLFGEMQAAVGAVQTAAARPQAAAVGGAISLKIPPGARPSIPALRPGIEIVGERLDLSEWVHVAAQGRDHYVKIVYEGHLYPFGHRAALIKITERKFTDTPLPAGGSTPVAPLIQREYIVVREPEKQYRGNLSGPAELVAGRKLPLTRVRLTTLVTPDLSQPLVPLTGTQFSFWVQVGTAPQDFHFHAVGTDIGGNQVDFTCALIFASLVDTPEKLSFIQSAYRMSGERRAAALAQQKLTYAARDPAAATDNTTLVTSALYFDTDAHPELLTTFGGYLPTLYKSSVHIPAIEQLLGAPTATTIRLYKPYVDGDFDAHAGVFAEIVKDTGTSLIADQLPVTFSADKAGGVATPNLSLSNLTRAHGPLAGDPAKAALDQFDANDFFGGFSGDLVPKLFGAIKLTDLLPGLADGASAAKNAPKTQFSTVDNPDGSKTLVVTFDWAPDVKPVDVGLASFTPNDNGTTALTIHGEVRKPIALPPNPAGPGSFAFDGKLTNFRLDILHAIALHFATFAFSAGSSKKLDVSVTLDPTTPFEFEGDLTFVQDLSNIIPPGAFGDGPSIDLTPAPGVHVGYGITLPPAGVGVFSLENISLSAGLDLPLLSGKPVIDIAFAERHNPFLLTVSLLGGGGFVHVQLDTEGMKLLEVAFEFGANASIDLGVASGGVHIMAGIYFAMQTDGGTTKATLSGYLRMGGELSVLGLISVALEFNLSFTYDGKAATGEATLTVEVKVLFFSKSVSISVQKRFGGSAGDPTFAQIITTPQVWAQYADAFA